MKYIKALTDRFLSSKWRSRRQKVLAGLMAFVVFVTTYALILPAITLDVRTAETEPGIEAEQTAEETLGQVQDESYLAAGQQIGEGAAAESAADESVSGQEATSAEAAAELESASDLTKGTDAENSQAADTETAVAIAADTDTEEESEEVYAQSPLIWHSKAYDVEISFDSEEWQLPENTVLTVKELDNKKEEDKDDYKYYDERARKELKELDEELEKRASVNSFYKLTLQDDGRDIDVPEGAVDITIHYNLDDETIYKEAKVFENDEEFQIALFSLTDEKPLLFEKNWDESEVISLDDDRISEIKIKDLELSDFENVIGLYVCPQPEEKQIPEVDGKVYEFELPEEGFASMETITEDLVLADQKAEDENGEEAIMEAKDFVAEIEKAEFSDPDLVWVGKLEEDTTVGTLKEENELEIEYPEKLTDTQIEEINAQEAQAGDWALIGMRPFDTEEDLTVTMKTGEVFTVKVTAAQISKDYISADGETYTITVTYTEEAQIPEDADLQVEEIEADSDEYKEYLEESAKELGTESEAIRFARFFDIQILYDGEKVEPEAPVQVSIAYKEAMEIGSGEALNIVHFAEEGTEVISETKISADQTQVEYEQSSFSVTGTIISEPPQGQENKYMVLVNYPNGSDNYYIVNNDGSLTKVNYNAANGTVDVEYPMLWTVDGRNPDRHIYFNTEATGFNWQDTAADYFRRYLDPNAESGITEENANNITLGRRNNDNVKTGYVVTNRSNMLSQTSINNYNDNGVEKIYHGAWNDHNALGVELDSNGIPVRVSGKNDWSDAVNVVFAEPRNVPGVDTTHHTVDHIDISISGKSEIKVPLAYGTYYYQDTSGNWQEYTVTSPTSLDLVKENVSITPEDMKGATIKAYNPAGEELDNAFVIDGYSSNASNAYSTVQVRIGGRFKVADTYDGGGNDYQTKQRRLNNKITYDVSAMKELTFDLEDDAHGQLYEKLPDGTYQKMSVTVDVNMSASFDYWDERNECPGIKNEIIAGSHDEWVNGGIPTHRLSGMDFVLGGDAEETGAKVVAVEITKMIVDENGRRIKPADSMHIVNSFDLYQDVDGNPNSVVGLNINEYIRPADNLEEYSKVHSKDVKVGSDGMGLVYDYAVTPGMFYIQENQDSIPDEITDTNGETWHFVGTRIETEYPWRAQPNYNKNDMHVSDTYTKNSDTKFNSMPEVLGPYTDINGNATYFDEETQKDEQLRNGFLEFFVYNIYEPEKTEVKVQKQWENGSAPEGASVDVVLKRYKLVPDGSITPPEPTTAELRITDSYSGLSGDRTYSASYHVTGPDNYNQTFNWTGSTISIPDLPFGEYTIEKTAATQDGYEAENLTETRMVSLGVAGANAVFDGTVYQRQNMEEIYHRVWVYAADTTNIYEGQEHVVNGHYTWVYEEYPEGSIITFTAGVPGWNNNSQYSYSVNGEAAVSIPIGQTRTENLTVNRDITIVINGSTPYYSLFLSPEPSVSVISGPRNARLTAARRALERGLGIVVLSNDGHNPEIEGYSWQEDSTWYEGNGLTVHLPDGDSWEKIVQDLEKEDAYGNVYVYYIDSVVENGMPAGMTAQIMLDGENKLFVYGNHSDQDNDTLLVKNILATGTDVSIVKVENGTNKTLTGAEFTIRKFADESHRNEIQEGGYPRVQSVDANGRLTLNDLEIGYYQIEESNPPEGYVKISNDPYFEVVRDNQTGEISVVFTDTDMVTYADGTFTVKNEPGAVLPSTGGPGSGFLTILGLILIAGTSGALLARRKRKGVIS